MATDGSRFSGGCLRGRRLSRLGGQTRGWRENWRGQDGAALLRPMRNHQGRARRVHQHIVAGSEDIFVHRDAGEWARCPSSIDGLTRGALGYLLSSADASKQDVL